MTISTFDRYYEVSFKEFKNSTVEGFNDSLDIFTFNTDTLDVKKTPLQMYGKVKKSLKSSGDSPDNILTLNIKNLPTGTISQLDATSILRVTVRLGYKNGVAVGTGGKALTSVVFVGDVKSLDTTYNGLDYTTTLSAMAGVTQKTGATVTKVVKSGASIRTTIEEVAKTFSEVYLNVGEGDITVLGGVSVVFEGDLLSDLTFANDRSWEGMTTKVLDEICNEFKVSWAYEGDIIHIYKLSKRDKVTNYEQITIEPSNVIGGLGVKFDTVGTNEKTETQASQISMKTFLDPRMSIQSLIYLSEKFDKGNSSFSGNYLPVVWEHNFNYRSNNNWDTTVTMLRSNLQEVSDG